jgi:hypothetical protein
MFKDLMHNLLGSSTGQQGSIGNTMTTGQISASAYQNSVLRQEPPIRRSASKKIFSGNIEVQQVANGFVVNIATREGYEYETHIAHTITEVNEIIAAAMVAFQLEK